MDVDYNMSLVENRKWNCTCTVPCQKRAHWSSSCPACQDNGFEIDTGKYSIDCVSCMKKLPAEPCNQCGEIDRTVITWNSKVEHCKKTICMDCIDSLFSRFEQLEAFMNKEHA